MSRIRFLLFIIAIFLLCNITFAWLRPHYEDAEVVERSELIVIGRIKPNTIQHVPMLISQKKVPVGSIMPYYYFRSDEGKCTEKEFLLPSTTG